MTKTVNDAVLDGASDIIITADKLILCAGAPTTYAEATALTTDSPAGKKLAAVAVDSSDFTKADGTTSGRKVTVAAQSGITVDASGTADHVALVDDGASRLLLVTALSSSQAVTSGNTVNIGSFAAEFADPT